MKTCWLCGFFLFFTGNAAIAQTPAINLPLIVSNDTGSKLELHFGLDPSATDTLDKSLGEQELPPFPPGEILEARFIGDDILLPKLGLGTYADYRMGKADFAGTKTYELKFQFGSGTKIIFKWNLPKVITGLMQDFFNGVVVNKQMTGSDSLVLTNRALNTLQMIIKYSGIPLAPTLISPANDSSYVYLNPGLIWHASRGTISYRFQVAIIPDFSTLVFDQTGIIDTAYGIGDLEKCTSYYWRVCATNANGASDWSEVWHFTTGEGTAVFGFEGSAPLKFDLAQNYPNPFNPATTIRFSLLQQAKVKLQVFDLLGREIALLADQEMSAGEHRVTFELNHWPNGVYIYHLSAGKFVGQRKMILLK